MKSKDRQTWVWGIVALAVCAAALYWSLRPAPPPQSTLETAAVEIGDLTLEVPATGSVDAVNVIDLGAPVTGRIQALHVDFNDRVKAGQVLAEIEDSNYRATFLQ